MAMNLIGRLSEHLEYNINIMDAKGIIIASTDDARIDTFHEAAYNIIRGDEDIEVIYPGEDLPSGVKPGVNLPIRYKRSKIGVVGVTGNPDEIKNLAYSVKTAVETMLEYELYKEKVIRRQDKKNLLLNTLLYEENLDMSAARNLVAKLGYKDTLVRIPLVFRFFSGVDRNDIASVLKTNRLHTQQDMTFITTEWDILVFKVLDGISFMLLENVKNIVDEYIAAVDEVLGRHGCERCFTCFAGSFQINLTLYREAYQHAQWLNHYIGNPDRAVYFFSDYLYEYFQSRILRRDYNNIFSVFERYLDPSSKKGLVETVEALRKGNMSIKKSAEELHVHRNTVSFRLENIKEQFGIDPLNKACDRFFLLALMEYCKTN